MLIFWVVTQSLNPDEVLRLSVGLSFQNGHCVLSVLKSKVFPGALVLICKNRFKVRICNTIWLYRAWGLYFIYKLINYFSLVYYLDLKWLLLGLRTKCSKCSSKVPLFSFLSRKAKKFSKGKSLWSFQLLNNYAYQRFGVMAKALNW